MKEIIGVITVTIALSTYLPYLKDTIIGKVKPHPFSWIIWTFLGGIAYAAQLANHAGPGAWMSGVALAMCILIILFSLREGFKNIKKFDIGIFCAALAALALWVITNDATWSVILVCIANTVAYLPTFRKSYHRPHEDMLYLYIVNAFRNGLSLLAFNEVSILTVLYPITIMMNCGIMSVYLLWRRSVMSEKAKNVLE